MAKILIIEPHPEVRELLVRAVARLGHEAVTPDAGDVAGTDLDLILLEPAVPGTAGVARVSGAESGVPVAWVTVGGVEDADGIDPVAVLVKPFALRDLERAVASALGLQARVPAA